MSPLVSILIPCYNASQWISATIESALSQTWSPTEIIVVDDGSTDDSLVRARRYESRGVRVISQSNRGASAARNTAARAAVGEWLQFLDADDLLASDKIERQIAYARELGTDFALCANWTRFTTTITHAKFAPEPLCTDAPPVDWLLIKLEHHRMMHPAAWLVSRSLAQRAGDWNEALSLDDDGEYFTRVVLASAGVRCCAQSMSYYRSQIVGSLSGLKSERALQSAFASLDLCTTHLLQVENSPRTRHACAVAWQRFVYEAYPRATDCRRRAVALVKSYGGCNLPPEGGPKFQQVRRWLGWKIAKRLQLR